MPRAITTRQLIAVPLPRWPWLLFTFALPAGRQPTAIKSCGKTGTHGDQHGFSGVLLTALAVQFIFDGIAEKRPAPINKATNQDIIDLMQDRHFHL